MKEDPGTKPTGPVPGIPGDRKMPGYDVIADFWEWYQRRQAREHDPIARLALDKCEESFRESQWDSFGYWYAIYLRERPKTPNSTAMSR
jgi:hypothetical protein